jgi:phage gp36-like protein
MGSYATTTSFSNLIPNLLAGNTTSGDIPGAAALDAHITRAESVVNSYISSRYSLPFTTVPPLVRTLSEDITAYFHIRGVSVQDGQRDNPWYESYKLALDMLKDIKDGKLGLSLTDGSSLAPASSSKFLSSTDGYAQTFNLDDSDKWEVDADRLDEISDGRE